METSKLILLVEDNRDDEDLTLRALRKHKIANEIMVVRDGAEAVALLFGVAQHAGRDVANLPQLVLLDLSLPRLSGLDVLRLIRGDPRTKFLPVVILTSSNEAEDIIRSYSLGANSYVRKPVSFAHFSEAVGTLGMYWLVLNEAPVRPKVL